jgi:hypothetical protein
MPLPQLMTVNLDASEWPKSSKIESVLRSCKTSRRNSKRKTTASLHAECKNKSIPVSDQYLDRTPLQTPQNFGTTRNKRDEQQPSNKSERHMRGVCNNAVTNKR